MPVLSHVCTANSLFAGPITCMYCKQSICRSYHMYELQTVYLPVLSPCMYCKQSICRSYHMYVLQTVYLPVLSHVCTANSLFAGPITCMYCKQSICQSYHLYVLQTVYLPVLSPVCTANSLFASPITCMYCKQSYLPVLSHVCIFSVNMCFDGDPFTCQCEKEDKKAEGFQILLKAFKFR